MLPDFSELITQAGEAFDDIIDNNGTSCILVYQGKSVACNNCVYDPIGKKSSGRWRTGGPLTFADWTMCPMCNGQGVKTTEYTESINMTIDWHLTGEKNKFAKPATGIRTPGGVIRTRGYLTDMPKVQKTVEMIVDDASSAYNAWKYKLLSEPVDDFIFVKNKYFSAFWERVG